MIRTTLRGCCFVILVAACAAAQTARPVPSRAEKALTKAWNAAGTQGAIVAGGGEAVDAGLSILKDGGNAVDAAVATILAQTVTDADQFCFGGEVPIIIYDARRRVVEVIAGMGTAPRLATREFFIEKGGIPSKGILAAAVPAALDACVTALDRFGTRRFSDVVAPALRILDRHEQPWHADLARTIRTLVAAEESSTDRRVGLRRVVDTFYRGPIAHDIDAWSREHGGLLRYTDLATHVTRVEDPVVASYRGHQVYKCGAWTQGPALVQALQILDGFDLKSTGPSRADSIHAAIESLKLAFADRDVFYADPLFVNVPLADLLAPTYAQQRWALIDMKRASRELRPGDPVHGQPIGEKLKTPASPAPEAHDTTTCLAADQWGNVVAATPSGWSGVLAGSTGVWLGSRLQSFNTWEGHPNVIVPGKRPRITLTPTLILKDDRPAFAVSVAGGDLQDQVSLQLVLDLIDFHLAATDAVTIPRFATSHHIGSFNQAVPKLGSLTVTNDLDVAVIEELRARGHEIQVIKPPLAAPSVLRIDPASARIEAAGDPKAGRHAGAL